VRADALPEHLEYHDGGCSVSPTCLRCPLERCRYDEPGGVRTLLQRPRDEAVLRFRDEGLGINALAKQFGISRRSVFRILARGRGRPVNGYQTD
jgi:transposase-like protein